MRKKTVFISGAISDNPNYIKQFLKAENSLRKKGYKVYSPIYLSQKLDYETLMNKCLDLIEVVDSVYFLKGWSDSRGSNREYGFAIGRGKRIVCEE